MASRSRPSPSCSRLGRGPAQARGLMGAPATERGNRVSRSNAASRVAPRSLIADGGMAWPERAGVRKSPIH
ncbi:hypothetical protein E2562_004861 [Oryza meyeriana var. granulata]|uniref:Uncharacterized protein n=1 Tax=Oryza meyeriana var. granulata TaxID=110450 RepID=A0A6G1C3P1_9ORYZ|nr:hypothetical protein E2562_004861 [Oryza meyeriana var. granulata]